ncbi:uncharacterized protein LOC135215536 [Macrobrachium nipponense]|uniref:uncharacterized protein LOC135215536 n=1 Tax=Macrobrachium nipponense TaxID=159736 RepID=UPI0030C86555
MASVVTTLGAGDLELFGNVAGLEHRLGTELPEHRLGTELPQGKFFDLRTVITVLCCNSESAISCIPRGTKSNVYFVCTHSGLDLDFADDCSWVSGSSIHRTRYVCLPNNALKRVAYRNSLYVIPQLTSGERTFVPLNPQPSHDDILEINTRTFSHLESADYKKRATWISKLPVRIWPVLPGTACVEYSGTSPEVSSIEDEPYTSADQGETRKIQGSAIFNSGSCQDVGQVNLNANGGTYDLKNNYESPSNAHFIYGNSECEGYEFDIPVLNVEEIEKCFPQYLPYEPEPLYADGVKSDFAAKPLYFYTTSNFYVQSMPPSIPVYKVGGEGVGGRAFENNDVTGYETDVSQLYADIAAKCKDRKISVVASNCGSGNVSSSLFSNFMEGTPLPEGKFLDMQDLIHALISCTPLDIIPRGFKKNLYFIVKQNIQGGESISLSKLYIDEFSWVGCLETTEAFYGKKTGEFERLVLKNGNYFLNSEKTPMNPQPTTDDILIVKRNYGSAQAPFSLQRRITLITNVPSYLHSSISLSVCVEYVSGLEGFIDGEKFSNVPFPVHNNRSGQDGTSLPHKSALTYGIPLPEGNFLDIDTLLAALVSRDSLSYIPDCVKDDVYFICNDTSNLFCRETREISSDFDVFGPWHNSHSLIISFIVHKMGSYERCYVEDELYYRQKKVGNDVKYELYDPQPSSNSILEIYRSHASSLGLWRRITWVVRAPKVLCSVVPHTACVEYLRLFRQGPLVNKSDNHVESATDKDRTTCSEGAPLPEGKFLSPRQLLQALRSAKPVDKIPEGLNNNMYFIVGIEKVKDLCGESDRYSGSEVTHEMYATLPESKSDVQIFKKRGFYCVKNGVPLLPQPTYDSILGIDRLTSTWRKSGGCKRQITWITKVPPHLAPLPTNLACVEYAVDSEACQESVHSLQSDSWKGAHDSKQKFVKSTVGQNITQPLSSLLKESDSLLKDVLFPISDDVRDSFIHHIEYRKGEITSLTLYKEEQLLNLYQFCCSDFHPSVLGVKTLFKNQAFNVTVLTYINYSVIHGLTGEHPVFIGPVFLHKDDDCLTYNVFLSHIKKRMSKIHGQVRGGKQNPLVLGTDVSKALQQSLDRFPKSCKLICSDDVKHHVLQMVKDHFNSSQSSDLVEKIVKLFVGSEGLCNSPNEKELLNQFRMAKLMGFVPSELLLQFENNFFPILKRNFATYDRHPWIKRGWVNEGSTRFMFELTETESIISRFTHMKNRNEFGGNILGTLVNNLYDCVQNQVNEVFSALMGNSELLTISDDFEMYKISRHLNLCLTEAQLFERFRDFLSGKMLKGKVKPREKIGSENVRMKSSTDPELVVQPERETPGKGGDDYIRERNTLLRPVRKNMNYGHRHEFIGDEVKPGTCKMNFEDSCEERPQLSQKRRRNTNSTNEPNTAMKIHGAFLGRHEEKAQKPQNRLLEEKKSELFCDGNFSPEALGIIDNGEVKELAVKSQGRNSLGKTVKDTKSEVVQESCEQYGQESVTPQEKIVEPGFGDSNCFRGLLVEKCSLNVGEVTENKFKKKTSSGPKSNGSLKRRKNIIVCGKLSEKFKVKSLRGQQRKLLKDNTGHSYKIRESNRVSIGRRQFTQLRKFQGNLQNCIPKSMDKQNTKWVEPCFRKSRKRKGNTNQHSVGNECQVVDGNSRRNSRKNSLYDEVKCSTDRKKHCLKKVYVKLEYLPQETLRKLSEHGSLLV